MAVSERNRLGVGGANKLSALEAQLNSNDGILRGVQPFGALDGRAVIVTSADLLQNLGANWVYTEVGTSTAETVVNQTATQPLRLVYTSGAAGAGDGFHLQYSSAVTLGSATRTAAPIFFPAAGKIIQGSMRFRITSTVTLGDMFFGACTADSTHFASTGVPKANMEGVGIRKIRATSVCAGSMYSGATPTITATTLSPAATVVASTWHTCGFKLNGVSSVEYMFDGETTGSTTVTNIPVAGLVPTLMFAASSAAAVTIEVSGICFSEENW